MNKSKSLNEVTQFNDTYFKSCNAKCVIQFQFGFGFVCRKQYSFQEEWITFPFKNSELIFVRNIFISEKSWVGFPPSPSLSGCVSSESWLPTTTFGQNNRRIDTGARSQCDTVRVTTARTRINNRAAVAQLGQTECPRALNDNFHNRITPTQLIDWDT